MLGMRRRQFITLLGGAAMAWPIGARCAAVGKDAALGCAAFTALRSPIPRWKQLRSGLRELGHVEGSSSCRFLRLRRRQIRAAWLT